MEQSDNTTKSEQNSSANTGKSTVKILEEVDKQVIRDSPPNFNSYIFTRIHDDPEGKYHG